MAFLSAQYIKILMYFIYGKCGFCMGVWDFIQDQVLGMKWLNELLGIGLSALGLDVNGRIGGSIQFFIYDVLKITVLLCVLIL